MKLKSMSNAVLTILIYGAASAFAQTFSAQCSLMSKEPKCWESRDNSDFQRPSICLPESHCSEVKTIHQDSRGKFHCTDTKGTSFGGEKLVREMGLDLEGLKVKVTTPYVDGCHILGGCGQRACVASYGTSSLDEACR